MHTHRSFFNPPALPHDVVEEAIERALRDPTDVADAADALVGSALDDDDFAFIQRCCVRVGTSAPAGNELLGLAGLCLGHTARRFKQLSAEAEALVEHLADRAERDPKDVDTRALDGRDDVRCYLHPDQVYDD